MTTQKTITLYKFKELDKKAQDRANKDYEREHDFLDDNLNESLVDLLKANNIKESE